MHFTLKNFTGFIKFVRAFNMNLVANRNLFHAKPRIVNCKKTGLATFILYMFVDACFSRYLEKDLMIKISKHLLDKEPKCKHCV